MAVVKTTRKDIIEKLQAKLTLQLGIHFTQQEVVDLCIEFAQERTEDLVNTAANIPKLTPQIAKEIITQIEQLPPVSYDVSLNNARNDDKDIYSI